MADQTQITILYGENQPASRQRLVELQEEFKGGGYELQHLEAKQLTLGKLEEVLGRHSLFENKQVVVIEGLHSLPRSKKKNELINLVAQEAETGQTQLILWEKRDLTATMLKQFKGARIQQFKLSKVLFKWLDSLGGPARDVLSLMHEAIDQDGAELSFYMLVRQIRLLIEVKSGGKPGGPPFMISKLNRQANNFTLEKLFALHSKILKIDLDKKTSGSPLSLPQALDLLWIPG